MSRKKSKVQHLAPRDVAVDMTAVTFIGTLAIGPITSACDLLEKMEHRRRIVRVSISHALRDDHAGGIHTEV